MQPLRIRVSFVVVALALGALGALAQDVRAQEAEASSLVVHGRVAAAGGAPISGAVVVSDAGGRAISDDAGDFSLALAWRTAAGSLRVTAFASGPSGTLSSSVLVGVVPSRAALDMGLLTLQPASGCEPSWLPAFGQPPGTTDTVSALAVFDDGTGGGPGLFVGGSFTIAGDVPANFIVKWDGSAWSPLGSGTNGPVSALAVFDDGSGGGPALYVGGAFNLAGGLGANHLARWDGQSWSPVSGGVENDVKALAVFDDGRGGGPALYVGGSFGFHLVRWNGTGWSVLGEGLDEAVFALTVFDDGLGGGPALYAGGDFVFSGHLALRGIGRWDGSSWSDVGLGLSELGGNPYVAALAVHDDGLSGGPALYVGGDFELAGHLPADNVARWDGKSWSTVGNGLGGLVAALLSFDDGSGLGPQLYAGMKVPYGCGARWDGVSWSPIADGSGAFEVLASFDSGDGRGPRLYAGGGFDTLDDVYAPNIASWDGASWSPLGVGFGGSVTDFAVFDDGAGSGPALYVSGGFIGIGGVAARHVARWDGSSWSALGSGLGTPGSTVQCLEVYDDRSGGGPALYAGGSFNAGATAPDKNIAKWDGRTWSAVGGGTNQPVLALASFADALGGGPHLYSCGPFTSAGGQPVTHIARWDGSAWSSFGALMNDQVLTLSVFDDGSGGGPALYAGGAFTFAGGALAKRIAKWDGLHWSALGDGVGGVVAPVVRTLGAFDLGDGEGPALYAGGDFTTADGQPANHVARWDGSQWSALGTGLDGGTILCLHGFNDGDGPAVFAGGGFTTAGGAPAAHIAKWDGEGWSPLGAGTAGTVAALVAFDDGTGSGAKLHVGGSFASVPESGDAYYATWGGCAPPLGPWTSLGFALPGIDGPPLLVGAGALEPATPGSLALTHAAPSALARLFIALSANPTPFKGGFIVPLPVALSLPLATSAAGTLALQWAAWPGGLSGLELDFQVAIQDAAAAHGVALSNALRAIVP